MRKSMTYRVIHCGSGAMGKVALQGILNHPDLELVGQFVWSPEKVGMGSGMIAGIDCCGVIATDNWEAPHALGADGLCDFGPSMPGERDRCLGHPAAASGATCVMPVVNAIPVLCKASAGLLGPLDLPRYWSSNVRSDARRPSA
jgi:hypothetical protein